MLGVSGCIDLLRLITDTARRRTERCVAEVFVAGVGNRRGHGARAGVSLGAMVLAALGPGASAGDDPSSSHQLPGW